ncbi:TIGR02302 family protein [Stappia sp.]|uniref:TIGR02302 family protein n=1 Tax=Stappia sp. TaxID=1870903 RepID=UPI0025CF89AD|nr:TIGR02302 family protein [Stappia sp.]
MNEANGTRTTQAGASAADSRIGRAVLLARAALLWERVWPVVQGPLIVAGLYVGLSWVGLWTLLPGWISVPASLLFLLSALWLARPLLSLRLPGRGEALARIERASGLKHHPLTALDDRLFSGARAPGTDALWEAHLARARAALTSVRSGGPDPRAWRKDPWGLRAVAAMLLIVGFFVADGERLKRLSPLAAPAGDAAADALRIDAWITPPDYTGRPPVFLTGATAALRDRSEALSVPQGSELTVRALGLPEASVRVSGEAGSAPVDAATGERAGAVRFSSLLETSGEVEIRDGERLVDAWRIQVEPDEAPTVRLLQDPEEQLSGAVKLTYLMEDDYGIVSGEGRITPARIVALDGDKPRRPLLEDPVFPLSLPAGGGRQGKGETIRDLTSHPYAGSEVDLVLSADDHAGQTGESPAHRFVLPQRRFANPLARAIVEQRRDLALDANTRVRVLDAFDALMLAPEAFQEKARTYLGMRFVRGELSRASDDDALREVVDLMWELALTIEDGDLSVAERALRNAQEALRKALEDGAPEEEIARLTDELRKALQDYMQALAQQMREQSPQAMQQMDPNAQTLSPQDLEKMLSRIEELARSGANDAARELLAEMQRMLENLQAGRPQQMPQGMTQEMMEALNQLGEMIQRQQELMDRTDRLDRRSEQDGERRQGGEQRREQQNGGGQMSPEELAEALRQLQQGQGQLGDQLQQLLDQMARDGMEGNENLGRAGEEMGEARDSLGEGETGQAVGRQGNALDALRQGAQGLAEQMMGQNQGPGMAGRRGGPRDQDPLGRPRRTEGPDFGERVQVPDEIDVQRARRILEELRRRFSEPGRPSIELDYLERLLRRY